jgi:diguanylate cyclase (GGDEF)-like protein/PAS domain S-box-containing protein
MEESKVLEAPDTSSASEGEEERLDRFRLQVTRDQINMLFQHAHVSVIGAGVLVLVTSFALTAWGKADPLALMRWVAVMSSVIVLRGFCIWRYFDTDGEQKPLYWANIFAVTTVVGGMVWFSLIGAADMTDTPTRELVLLIIFAVSASSMVYAPFYWPITAATLIGILGPFAGSFYAGSSVNEVMLGHATIGFGLFIGLLATGVYKPFKRLLQFRYQNVDLVQTLSAERDKVRLALIHARDNEGKFRILTERSPVGIFQITLDGTFVYANPAMRAILEVEADQTIESMSLDKFLTPHARTNLDTGALAAQTGRAGQTEVEIIGAQTGKIRNVTLSIVPLPGHTKTVPGLIATAIDVTDRRRAEMTVRHMAHHDVLTGLVNRTEFRNRLEEGLANAARNDRVVGLAFLDIMGFKSLNESIGHSNADKVLKELSERMKKTVRRTDTVARLGPDEFAIVATNQKNLDGVIAFVRKILGELTRPYKVPGRELRLDLAMGVTIYPTDDTNADRLIQNADFALKRAKEKPEGGYHLYDQSMHLKIQDRIRLEEEMRVGLDRGEFMLYFQPQIELATGRLIGAEALMRWQHPERGFMPPGEFIPLAESSRLIIPMSEWLIHAAAAQAKSWQKFGLPPFTIGINVSPLHLESGDLADEIAIALKRTGLNARWIDVEITEGMVMTGSTRVLSTLERLREIGVGLSIDDFGTGYSSLSYLKKYPFKQLKVDQSFVRGVPENRDDTAIVEAVVRLGQSLNISVIAEGVETAEQQDFLKSLGCHAAQGYFYGRPMPAQDFVLWIERWEARRTATAERRVVS